MEPNFVTSRAYLRAFWVHVFTASGAALALLALLAAVGKRWDLTFLCLGLALLVDGIDGTIARRLNVAEVLPRWNGDVLDLVVDFVTYVFVPAFMIAAGGLLPETAGVVAGIVIVITGAIYFADRQMKTADHYFRGFPTLWNAAAFYLFLLRPDPWIGFLAVIVLAVLTFVPFKFVHPFRVRRLRLVTIAMVGAWSALGLLAVLSNLDPDPWTKTGLVLAGCYFVGVGIFDHARES